MENEIDAAEEKEEQCPYKKIKLDAQCEGDEVLVTVTSLENAKDLSSNGGVDGEKLQMDLSADFIGDAEAEGEVDGESDNGKCREGKERKCN